METTCTNCRKPVIFDDHLAVPEIACTHCGQKISLRFSPPSAGTDPDLQTQPRPRPRRRRALRGLGWIALSCLILAFAVCATASRECSGFLPWPALTYVLLVAACCVLSGRITTAWFRGRFFGPAAAAVSIAAVLCYGACDGYTTTWYTVWDAEKLTWRETDHRPPGFDRRFTRYEDSYHRWRKQGFYRRVWFYEAHSALPDWAEGPMTASNKQHGQWEDVFWHPYQETHRWYWYGEEVTEGEWQVRNR